MMFRLIIVIIIIIIVIIIIFIIIIIIIIIDLMYIQQITSHMLRSGGGGDEVTKSVIRKSFFDENPWLVDWSGCLTSISGGGVSPRGPYEAKRRSKNNAIITIDK